MRVQLLCLIVGLPCIGLVSSAWFGLALARFLKRVPAIQSPSDMYRLKRTVAAQMYAALVQIVILGAPVLLFFFGVVTKILYAIDFLFVVVPSLAVFGAGMAMKTVERRVKTMPVSDEFADDFRHVIEVWMRKPFPDW